MAVTITKENFDELVMHSDKKVLLDFWAVWCGPCQMLGPIVEEIHEERPDILVGKVDVDTEGDLAKKYRIMSIPTVLVLEKGEVVQRSVGFKPKAEILALLDK